MGVTVPGHPLTETAQHTPARTSFWTLTLGSIGVVYGDIGTSPLYAFKESLRAAADGQTVTRPAVLGTLSLILWALILVVTVKYVLLILRADNNGEGGTITLMALLQRKMGHHVLPVTLLGMGSAALFYGDAIITPAISVLSAVEGLKLAAPALEHYVEPISICALIGLFVVQSRGDLTGILYRARREATAWPQPWVGGRPDPGR